MTKTKVTIDRAKWRCGGECGDFANGKGQTKLLNHEGYMCCLGFITAAANPELNILEKGEPDDLKTTVPELTCLSLDFAFSSRGWLNTNLTVAAIAINDSETLTAQEREEQLLELFKNSLYELEFVGEYEAKENTHDE
jgi:hypothetical protein